MVFSSFNFLFAFFPAMLLAYYILPGRYKAAVLLLSSLIFYYIGVKDHPEYMALLLASVVINYALSRKIAPEAEQEDSLNTQEAASLDAASQEAVSQETASQEAVSQETASQEAASQEASKAGISRKSLLILGICYNVFWLFLFKYAAFFRLPVPELAMPVGISFYTFSAISYLADVYMGTCLPADSLLSFGTYLTMFPKLVSGPIATYSETEKGISSKCRSFSLDVLQEGLRTFCIGLGLKVILANRLGGLWNQLSTIGYDSLSTPLAWFGIGCYSLELYFDFYGYSLMAMGIGQMLGIDIPENFRHPYMSRSMTEFWRRWHITLGRWFRKYIYIPLGGNRVSTSRLFINLLVVWTLTGLWHGASMNFVLWGLGLFVIMWIEKNALLKFLDSHLVLSHLYMILLIPLSWMVFAITDFTQLGLYASRLIPVSANITYTGDFLKYFSSYGVYFTAGLLFCTNLPRRIYDKFKNSPIADTLLILLLLYSIYNIYMGLDDPFMYFQF